VAGHLVGYSRCTRGVCARPGPEREEQHGQCRDRGDRPSHDRSALPSLRGFLFMRGNDLVHALMGDTEAVRNLPEGHPGAMELDDGTVVLVAETLRFIEARFVVVPETPDALELVHSL
jgi:hypothetical protein